MRTAARYLALALWPSGFWCERCGGKHELPWLAAADGAVRNGCRAICPTCKTETSLCDARLRTLLQDVDRVVVVSEVCLVHNVSLKSVLQAPRLGRNPNVRRVMMRALLEVMDASEVGAVFGTTPKSIWELTKKQASYEPVWRKAMETRQKEIVAHERAKEKRRRAYAKEAYRKRATEAAGLEDPAPDR